MTDLDGTLLGTPGTLLPQSERGWDTVPAYGLGDYRIPTSMMTSPDGSRLYPEDICPNKGQYSRVESYRLLFEPKELGKFLVGFKAKLPKG